MKKNSFFNRFTPKEPKFFPLLKQMSEVLLTASDMLIDCVQRSNPQERVDLYRQIKEQERIGDKLFQEIFNELGNTFITPFDREDIHHLAGYIDDVTDGINSSAKRIAIYNPKEISKIALDLALLIKQAAECIHNVIDQLDSSFDYILIDCPAGVEAGFHRAVFPATEAIIVVTPHLSSIRDADKVIGLLNDYDIQYKGLVINRVRGDLLLNGEMMTVENIVRALNLPLLGVIPEDDAIGASNSLGSRVQSIESARAFTLLSENIHNGSKKIFDCTYKYRGLMGYIKRNIKKHV